MVKYEKFFEAAENNDEEAVRRYVEHENVPVNATTPFEITAAHIAARKGNLGLVKFFVEKDPSILRRNKYFDGETILLMAIKYGHLDVVKYLVETCSMPVERRFSQRYYGNTAVHLAVEYDEPVLLKYLLEERKADVNVENDVMQTPLFLAVENRCHPIAKYLIEERGADVSRRDYMDDTILDKAANKDDFDMMRYLTGERNITADEQWKNDLVHRTASFNRLGLLKFLVEELHADMNVVDRWGKTALHKAASQNHYDVCKYLIERGASQYMIDDAGLIPAQETNDEKIIALFSERHPIGRRSILESTYYNGGQPLSSASNMLGENPASSSPFHFHNFLLIARALFGHNTGEYRRNERQFNADAVKYIQQLYERN